MFVVASCTTAVKKSGKKVLSIPKDIKLSPPVEFFKSSYSLSQVGSNEEKDLAYIFLNKNKKKHEHSQVKMAELGYNKIGVPISMRNHGVTVNRAENYDPVGFNKNEVIFLSTTDEDKEYPKELNRKIEQKFSWPFDNIYPMVLGEIYYRQVSSFKQKRLTFRRGYDYHPAVVDQPKGIFFVSRLVSASNSIRYQIHFKSLHSKLKKMVYESTNLIMFPHVSNDGQLLWVEYNKETNSSSLVRFKQKVNTLVSSKKKYKIKGGTEVILGIIGLIHAPKWSGSAQEIILSSNYDDVNNFEIYEYTIYNQCLKRLTYDHNLNLWPIYGEARPGELVRYIYTAQGKDKRFNTYHNRINPTLPCHTIN